MPRFESRSAELTRITHESSRVNRFFFSLETPLVFQPGQAVALSIPGVMDAKGMPVKRMFSVVSLPGSEIELCIALKDPPSFSASVAALRIGDKATVEGPFGQFCLKFPVPTSIALISAGTGVAPMICMLRALQEQSYNGTIDFVFGFRTPDDFLYKEELQSRAASNNMRFTPILSGVGFPEWQGKRGRVPIILSQLIQNTGQDVYLCGPPAMVQDTVATLLSMGFAPQKIRRERW